MNLSIHEFKTTKLLAMKLALQFPEFLDEALNQLHIRAKLATSYIPLKPLGELIDPKIEIKLSNCMSRKGNLTPYELMAVASLVAATKPERLLEIGTFDGNTTLQMALNASEEAIVHTIDLPEGEMFTHQPILDSDLQYALDSTRKQYKFLGSEVARKIVHHEGDSTNFDWSVFAEDGLLQFIFIDGGHTYECFNSDTEKALNLLAPGGTILWHGFTPYYAGVYQFINELGKELPLIHISETNLILYQKKGLC